MGPKLYFLLAGTFLLIMNVLLWRTEYGQSSWATPVPPDVVVQHLLDAADPSNLEIRQRGAKIGYGRWSPTILTVPTLQKGRDAAVPEGMVSSRQGYDLDFDGSLTLESDNRLRFNVSLTLNTNYQWQELQLRLFLRPYKWEILADAGLETVDLAITEEDETRRQQFHFNDFKDPGFVVRQWGGPVLARSLELLAPSSGTAFPSVMPMELEWRAYTDRLRLGHALLNGYRLQARLFEGFEISLLVLQSGEILRVELPHGIALVNDDLLSL